MARLLLPGNWNHIAPKVGLNKIIPSDFEGRLYNSANIKSAGVPSILAHPYVFTKALTMAPPNPQAMQQFTSLVKALFLGIVDVNPIDLAIGNRLTKLLQSFEPRMNHFYILKWKNMTVGGIYPDCLAFPGAKFVVSSEYEAQSSPVGPHPEPDYSGITFQNLEKEIEKRISLYSPDLVKALFARWIQEIIAILALPSGDGMPVWLQRLLDVSNTEWNTTLVAPNGSLDDFTSVSNTVQLRHNRGITSIPLRKITQNIFCERIVQFANGDIPDIPVKSQHLRLIDIAATTYMREGGNVRYSIQLKGWPGPIQWSPIQAIDGDQGSILLWPNFKADGWNVNYVFFAPSTIFSGLRPKLRLMNADFTLIKELSEREGCRTNVPVEYVEVLLQGEPAGVFVDNRKRIGRGQTNITISLDFGTTHTSIGVKDDNTGEYQLFNFEDMTHDILGMDYFYSDDIEITRVRRGSFWFPPASFDDALTALPSELVFKTKELLLAGDHVLNEPLKNFRLPHPKIEQDRLHEIIVANFKWNAPEPFTREQLTKSYLKIVLHMGLAVLRRNYLCTNVSIVPTYPLAFGRKRFKEYREILVGPNGDGGIFAEIFEETGINLSLAIVNTNTGLQELVAESYAAKAFWSPAPGTAELVVDIGGETTDIALWVNGNEFVDSFQYGANRYLQYLARHFRTYPPGVTDLNERMIALQKKMRESGIGGVLNIYPPAQKVTAQQAIDRFFQGLFEYLYRLLSASGAKKVHLYPAGNGWRLIEGYVPPSDNIPNYVNNWFDGKGISFSVSLPKDSDYKGLVCKGARRIADGGWYIHPDLTTPVKTILGGDIQVSGVTKKWNDMAPTGPLGTPPLGFDVTPFIKSLPFSSSVNIDIATISGLLANHCQNATYLCPGGMLGLNKSIFAVFLEKIYPEYYL